MKCESLHNVRLNRVRNSAIPDAQAPVLVRAHGVDVARICVIPILTGDHGGVLLATTDHFDLDVERAKSRNCVHLRSVLVAEAKLA